jgi:putative inorganic carbon (hco3(-)) transporter
MVNYLEEMFRKKLFHQNDEQPTNHFPITTIEPDQSDYLDKKPTEPHLIDTLEAGEPVVDSNFNRKNSFGARFKQWFYQQTFAQKLQNPLGFLALILLGLVVTVITAYLGILGNAALIVLFVGGPIVLLSMFDHQIGLVVMLVLGFSIPYISKATDAPIGMSMDGLLFLMLLGIMIQQIRKRDWSFASGSISYWVLGWIVLNLLQGLNPWCESRFVWIYTVRSMALLLMLYFIACNAFDSKKKIIWMINFILAWGTFAALWAFKQEYLGFTQIEETWLYADELRFELFFQWTRMRIFSILRDPTTFGIMMSYMALFVFVIAMQKGISWQKRSILIFICLIMTAANSFSGTRTSMAILPFGFILYTILNPTRNVIIFVSVFFLFGTALIFKGTSNAQIYRIQSAFKPSEDESALLRIRNQKFIRPFIHSHPIGYGLGTCGVWAKRFTPEHWLAKFSPDSGFVRIAVEQGWIGLFYYMCMLVAIMHTGIYYYFRVKDPQIKLYYLGLNLVMILLMVATYPQEAIIQLPTSIIYYIFVAAITRLKDFDPAFNDETSS